MRWYAIGQTLIPVDCTPGGETPGVVLITSEELPALAEAEPIFRHTPAARDARVCKAESHPEFMSGTLLMPRPIKGEVRLAAGWLITAQRVVLVDDGELLLPYLRRMVKEKYPVNGGVGRFFYGMMSMLTGKDLHRLEEIEDQAEQLEDRVLEGQLEGFSPVMTALRKNAMAWFRYYSQLDDVAGRLREESQLLREYCLQIQSLFQAEIDLRQNRIMKILTIVTTIFLPLSLLAGWYGMNFVNMPELTWEYGYPAVIAAGLGIVLLSLWICKKKKFW